MNWTKIKNGSEFARVLRATADLPLNWKSLSKCAIGTAIELSAIDTSSNYTTVPVGTKLTDKDGIKTWTVGPSGCERKVLDSTKFGSEAPLRRGGSLMFCSSARTLWCVSPKNETLKKFMRKFGLEIAHIRAIEMCNDHTVLQRLALRNIFPVAGLYKSEIFMKIYIREIANIIAGSIQIVPKVALVTFKISE